MTETQSTTSVKFRSRLEREVADELTELGIRWEYEQPVTLPNGQTIYYLPDFHIPPQGSIDGLPLPRWIEAKPQNFIYDLRDSLGITRQYGDRFSGVAVVNDIDHLDLKSRHIEELWKPKKLAEVTDEAVLIVGGVGGTNRLSVTMLADRIEFSRDNWIVNWKGVEQRREREARAAMYARQREVWEQERIRRDFEYQRQLQEEAANKAAARAAALKVIRRYNVTGRNRYDQQCFGCGRRTPIGTGWLRNVAMADGSDKWIVVCAECEVAK